jgi:hypothetical protein
MILATILKTVDDGLETGKSLLKDIGDKTNSFTNLTVDTIHNSSVTTQAFVKEGIGKANNFTEIISQNLQLSLNYLWKNWLVEHRLISFSIAHPVIALIIFITIILSIWGFIQMIPSLFANLWLIVFKSPFSLMKLISQNNNIYNNKANSEPLSDDEKDILFEKLLSRLETINAEQKLILKQLSEIKKDG